MTVIQRQPPARVSGSHGPGFVVVKVDVVDPANKTCICRDSKNIAYQVRTDLLPGKGASPQAGEHWIINKHYGDWLFSHVYMDGFGGTGVAPSPAVLGGRRTTTYTTGELAAGDVEEGTIALAPGYRILYIQTSHSARVRLYTSVKDRLADLDRGVSMPPAPGLGLVMDYLTADELLAAPLSPVPEGANFSDPVDRDTPISVTSVAGGPVIVTLTWVATE